jgi:polyphosphate:AMP phosphotransferase
MFESAELGHRVEKKTYDAEVPKLRAGLLDAQGDLITQKKFPVILLIGGLEGAGKGETVHVLTEWMDPRHIESHAMGTPDCREIARPPMWRFWQALPPKGKLGIFFGSWYTAPIVDRAYGRIKAGAVERTMDDIVRFETMLTDEGALILKFWMHLTKKAQRKRLKELEADPATRWRVKPSDWRNHDRYDKFRAISEEVIQRTSSRDAPWIVVEGEDARYRHLTVGRVLHEALRGRLDAPKHHVHMHAPPMVPAVDNRQLIRALDLTKKLSEKQYEKELPTYQGRLSALSRRLEAAKLSVSIVFEGPDASGKGGAIRRIAESLDARHYRIIPIAAPNEEERSYPYLWRFWRHVPGRGTITIFDRSWYGRVLVERVEELAPEADWMRAYSEINDFERQLVDHGTVLVKIWLAVSKAEQLARFKAREKEQFKRFKITADDWRNRKKWEAYEQAACDMVDRTSTDAAPWTLVEGNDKHFARVKVLKTIVERIEAAL